MISAERHSTEVIEAFGVGGRRIQTSDIRVWHRSHPLEQVTLHAVNIENKPGTLAIFFGGQHAGTEPMGIVAAHDSVMLAANTLEHGALVAMSILNRSGWLLGNREMSIHSLNAADSNRKVGASSVGEVAEFMNGIVDISGILAKENANRLSKQNSENVSPAVAVDWHAEADFALGVPEEASTPYVRLVDIGDDKLLAKTIELAFTTGLPIVFDYSSNDEENDDIQDVTLDAALINDKKIPTIVIELGSGVVTERYRQIVRAVSVRLWYHYGMVSRATMMRLGEDKIFHQLPNIPRDQPLRLHDSFGIDPKGKRIQGGDAVLLLRSPGDYVTRGLQVATRINLLRIQEDQQPIFADNSGWVLSTVGPYTVNYADPERELMLVASSETDARIQRIYRAAYTRYCSGNM